MILPFSREDEEYNQIRKCIKKGMEKGEIKKLHPDHPAHELSSIWPTVGLTEEHKEELITIGGNRIFIPRLARKQILDNLHCPHMGYNVTQQLAKTRYFWRTLNEDIKRRCQGCEACVEFSKSKVGEAEVLEEQPNFPMEHMSVDLFTWDTKKFALLINWYSNYCFLKRFRTEPSTQEVVEFLEEIFLEHGFCLKLRSDGGPQFREQFGDWTRRMGIDWSPSSGYYSQSNGRVERSIGIVKDLLAKTQRSSESFREAWFALQNTPHTAEGFSPARLFYGRILRDPHLPQLEDDLDERVGRDTIQANKERRKRKKNEEKRRLNTSPVELKVGMNVILQGPSANCGISREMWCQSDQEVAQPSSMSQRRTKPISEIRDS